MTIQEDLIKLQDEFKTFKSNDFIHLVKDVADLKKRLSWISVIGTIITSGFVIIAALLG